MKRIPMWRRFDRLLGADRASDVREELGFHIEARVDDLISRGWQPDAARREAERQLAMCVRCREWASTLEELWIDASA